MKHIKINILIFTLLSIANTTYSQNGYYSLNMIHALCFGIADMNLDGNPNFIFGGYSASPATDSRISIQSLDDSCQFTEIMYDSIENRVDYLVVCQLDENPIPEIVYASSSSDRRFGITIMYNYDKNDTIFIHCGGYWYDSKIFTGDFNGDGKTDIIYTGFEKRVGEDNLLVWGCLLNQDGCHFIHTWEILQSKGIDTECSGDLNNDGFDDIVINNSIYYGSENGLIKDDTFEVNKKGYSYIEDLDGDGKKDLIVTDGYSSFGHTSFYTISVAWNRGDSFSDFETIGFEADSLGAHYTKVCFADLNNDGYVDIVFYDDSPCIAPAYGECAIYILYNKGNHQFEQADPIEFYSAPPVIVFEPWRIACYDIDNNGYADIIVSRPFCLFDYDYPHYNLIIKFNNGKGEFVNTPCHIVENEENESIQLYPNPVKGILVVEVETTSVVVVHNTQGQEVMRFVAEKETKIDVSRLPSGVYAIKILGDNVVSKKFVKE